MIKVVSVSRNIRVIRTLGCRDTRNEKDRIWGGSKVIGLLGVFDYMCGGRRIIAVGMSQ